MKFNDTIRLRIFKDKLLYITVCVLSGLTAIPLLAILGRAFRTDSHSIIGYPRRSAHKRMETVELDIPVRSHSECLRSSYGSISRRADAGRNSKRHNRYIHHASACCRSSNTGGHPLRRLPRGIQEKLVLDMRQLSYRLAARHTVDHHRHHHLHLGRCPDERLFRDSGKRGVVYNDASAHHPLDGRNYENIAGNAQGSRARAWRKLLAGDAQSDVAVGIRQYLHWHPACHIACGRRNRTIDVHSPRRIGHQLQHRKTDVCRTAADLGILQ